MTRPPEVGLFGVKLPYHAQPADLAWLVAAYRYVPISLTWNGLRPTWLSQTKSFTEQRRFLVRRRLHRAVDHDCLHWTSDSVQFEANPLDRREDRRNDVAVVRPV